MTTTTAPAAHIVTVVPAAVAGHDAFIATCKACQWVVANTNEHVVKIQANAHEIANVNR